MKNVLLVIVFLVSLVLLGATARSHKTKMLVGVWKIEEMMINGQKMYHEQLGEPFVEFNKKEGFLIKMGANMEKGKYFVIGDTIMLIPLYPPKPAHKLVIDSISAALLKYHSLDTAASTSILAYRITEGLKGERD